MKSIILSALLLSIAHAQEPIRPHIETIDPALAEVLDETTPIETLAEGFQWIEGPVWDGQADRLLFSEIPANTIHAWSATDGGTTVFMKPSGFTGVTDYGREPGSNGLAFDAEHRLIACEHGDRRISMLTPNGGKITLADRYQGKRLNSPNDLAIASDGTIYFTDPIYGLPGGENDPQRELDFCGVFRLATDGSLTLVSREIERPNGIGLSPDGRTLFVANSHGPRPHLFSIAIHPDGTFGQLQTFFDASKLEGRGAPDGFKIDAAGVLWASGPGGLLIISPEGKLLGRVHTGRATSNVAIGGKDGDRVFMTCDDRLMSFIRRR